MLYDMYYIIKCNMPIIGLPVFAVVGFELAGLVGDHVTKEPTSANNYLLPQTHAMTSLLHRKRNRKWNYCSSM